MVGREHEDLLRDDHGHLEALGLNHIRLIAHATHHAVNATGSYQIFGDGSITAHFHGT
jgi:hypothetical protein